MHSLSLQPEDPGSADARSLVAQLDQYLVQLYPPESNHLLSIESLRQPNVTFLVARVEGQAAGCGAFVNQPGDYAEIKRMFVLPPFRGMNLGRRILAELERLIRAAGLSIARLETGIAQSEALRLFERSGYRRRGPFGEYRDDPLSVFMEKSLAAAPAEIALPAKPPNASSSQVPPRGTR